MCDFYEKFFRLLCVELIIVCVANVAVCGENFHKRFTRYEMLTQAPLRSPMFRRSERIESSPPENIIKDCMTVTSDKGRFYYETTVENVDAESSICGVYLVADANEVLQVHFDYIDMPCESSNVVEFFDGWELNGSYFPNDDDFRHTTGGDKKRSRQYCGKKRVKEMLISSQNAALIRYRVPKIGKGFSFFVTSRKNPMPCNIVAESASNIYTLRNYGQRANCTLLVTNPANIQIVSLTVGTDLFSFDSKEYVETGTFHDCERNDLADYVEIGKGRYIGQSTAIDSICGIDSTPGEPINATPCGVTTIRLVSSGKTNNIITFVVNTVNKEEISTETQTDPLCSPENK